MKLIKTRTLEVVDFFGSNIPPYAILSHTWVEGEEVSYQEMMAKEGRDKFGFQKIKKCCEQAVRHDLEWVWIDTCSIDKTSSSELSEAINSMYRYYAEASVCYVYLVDVDYGVPPKSITFVTKYLPQGFTKSRWFTRGWTLQELLAPKKLVFFSRDWEGIGERAIWTKEISRITSINEEALTHGAAKLSDFSIANRMSWAASRETTREEDMAYCLLGIFGVHMPLLYGEGKNAFIRLQEEIMKNSDDQSIFAWQASPSPRTENYPSLLSPTVKYFHKSTMRPINQIDLTQPYSMTNAGLQITGVLARDQNEFGDIQILCLPVYDETNPDQIIGVPLRQLSGRRDQFERSSALLVGFPSWKLQQIQNISSRQIYIRKEGSTTTMPSSGSIHMKHQFRIIIPADLDVALRIDEVYPPHQVQWASAYPIDDKISRVARRFAIHPPKKKEIVSHLHRGSWHAVVLFSVNIDWLNQSTPVPNVPGMPIIPILSLSETCRCVLYIGYNGRTNESWCSFDGSVSEQDLEVAKSCWKRFPDTFGEISRWQFRRRTSDDTSFDQGPSGVEMEARLETMARQKVNEHLTFEPSAGSTLALVTLTTRLLNK